MYSHGFVYTSSGKVFDVSISAVARLPLEFDRVCRFNVHLLIYSSTCMILFNL